MQFSLYLIDFSSRVSSRLKMTDRGCHLLLLPFWRHVKSDASIQGTGKGLGNINGRRFIAGSIRHRKLQVTLTTLENNEAIPSNPLILCGSSSTPALNILDLGTNRFKCTYEDKWIHHSTVVAHGDIDAGQRAPIVRNCNDEDDGSLPGFLRVHSVIGGSVSLTVTVVVHGSATLPLLSV